MLYSVEAVDVACHTAMKAVDVACHTALNAVDVACHTALKAGCYDIRQTEMSQLNMGMTFKVTFAARFRFVVTQVRRNYFRHTSALKNATGI